MLRDSKVNYTVRWFALRMVTLFLFCSLLHLLGILYLFGFLLLFSYSSSIWQIIWNFRGENEAQTVMAQELLLNQWSKSLCFSNLLPGDHVLCKEPKDLGALLHHHMITCIAASSSVKTSGDLLTQGELPTMVSHAC